MNRNCNEGESCPIPEMAVSRNCTAELLDELHRNVTMGTESITDVLPKVKTKELTEFLTSQLNDYAKYSAEIKKQMEECGGEIKGTGIMTKMSAKIGIEMNTLKDSSDEHIAEMIIEGTTMGITDTIRLVRDYENSNCSEQALSLARRIVSFQERSVEKAKSFL